MNQQREPYRIALIGPQGSGKGTQGELLSKQLNIPAISTGALFREQVASGTPLGKEAQAILASGKLVDDSITKRVLEERLSRSDAQQGYILDGYPRNRTQQNDLDTLTTITHAIVFAMDDDESIRRITGRRQCANNHVYHVTFHPPKREGICDEDGLAITQRGDDTEDAVRQRLAIYHRDTEPIIAAYHERGIAHEIDASRSLEEVRQQILKELV